MNDIKDVFKSFEECFRRRAEEIGFTKARKCKYVRRVGQCIQHINILDTKIRGQQAINIRISVGITYVEVNKKVAELRVRKYDSKWATGGVDLGSLSVPVENFSRYLVLDTDIDALCEEIFYRIEANASQFWAKTDTMDKFMQGLLDDDEDVRSCTAGLWRPSWTSLALACLTDQSKLREVLEKYKDFFIKNMSEETKRNLKETYCLEEVEWLET
ncbi:hypothetical protein [Butyrivibrio sp. LB2008]|jgi:hypothetical protein|uniref:hypothetical protein n=1 Tax=Butyrivibrio sp. LB2008 TaxID=1408305 RepID=UPI00047D6BA4|nr:hypothetical protein [Butyrivibrio sp. LB2008]